MKKLIALLLALVLVFALCACAGGGNDDSKDNKDGNKTEQTNEEVTGTVYGGWFTAQFPEGFSAYDETEEDFRRDLDEGGYDQDRICVYIDDSPFFLEEAEDYVTNYDYVKEEKTIGDYDWLVYTDPDGDDVRAYTVLKEKEDGFYVGIELFIDWDEDGASSIDNEEVVAFIESLKVIADNPYEAHYEFKTNLN